jgi:DNA-binding transcriptional ArsR family regulator
LGEHPPITNISDPRWVRAISHPLRIRLLAMLDEEAASPVVLANKLQQPLGTIAYHVRTLYDLGLLELVRTRQRRGATEHYYKTSTHPRFTDGAWGDLDTVSKQRVLTAILDRAHDYASRSAAAGGFDAADAHFTSTPLKLDAKGWTKLASATKRWLEETARIEREAAKRIAKEPHASIDVGLVILLFEALPFSAEVPQSDGHRPQSKVSAPPRRRTPRTDSQPSAG